MVDRLVLDTYFYDRPREGIATFRGDPVYFDNAFDYEQDEYSDIYNLYAVPVDLLEQAADIARRYRDWWYSVRSPRFTEFGPVMLPDRHVFDRFYERLRAVKRDPGTPIAKATVEFLPSEPVDTGRQVDWNPTSQLVWTPVAVGE